MHTSALRHPPSVLRSSGLLAAGLALSLCALLAAPLQGAVPLASPRISGTGGSVVSGAILTIASGGELAVASGGELTIGTGATVTFDDPLSLANGGTGVALADPGADRLAFWDDSAGAVAWLTLGEGLTITDDTLDGAKVPLSASATLDFASIASLAAEDLTITVTGAAVGDAVALGLPAAPTAGIVFLGFVSAADTVTVRAINITAGAVDPASASYRATVLQP